MGVSLQLDDAPFTLPLAARFPPTSARSTADRAHLRIQLGTILEILQSLERQTVAGQRNTMAKVVGFLRGQLGRGLFIASPRNEGVLAHLVEQLAREAQRLLPDVRSFSAHADTLVALLIATT
jgi:hypothetical protein